MSDPKGFERYCRRSRDLGYTGVFTIHPNQRAIADDVFGISALDLQSARTLIEGSKDAQLVRLNGKLVRTAHAEAGHIPARPGRIAYFVQLRHEFSRPHRDWLSG